MVSETSKRRGAAADRNQKKIPNRLLPIPVTYASLIPKKANALIFLPLSVIGLEY